MPEKISEHWFWFGLLYTALAWYITVTTYVAIKGAADVKQMLKSIGSPTPSDSSEPPSSPTV